MQEIGGYLFAVKANQLIRVVILAKRHRLPCFTYTLCKVNYILRFLVIEYVFILFIAAYTVITLTLKYRLRMMRRLINFAERVRKTWEAVTLGKYHNPDELVSFDSEKIPANFMQKLRSEACRIPLKPSDKIKFYTKQEMRNGVKQADGSKIVIPSPNLFDAVVLSFDNILSLGLSGIRQASERSFCRKLAGIFSLSKLTNSSGL